MTPFLCITNFETNPLCAKVSSCSNPVQICFCFVQSTFDNAHHICHSAGMACSNPSRAKYKRCGSVFGLIPIWMAYSLISEKEYKERKRNKTNVIELECKCSIVSHVYLIFMFFYVTSFQNYK